MKADPKKDPHIGLYEPNIHRVDASGLDTNQCSWFEPGSLEAVFSGSDEEAARSAFDLLVEAHGPLVKRFLDGRNRIDGEDVYQDACFKAWNSRGHFLRSRRSFRGWLFLQAKGLQIDWLRSNGERTRLGNPRPTPKTLEHAARVPDQTVSDAYAKVLGKETSALLGNWLATLDPTDRLILRALAVDRSYADIAAAAELTVDQVRYRLRAVIMPRARAYLKRIGIENAQVSST